MINRSLLNSNTNPSHQAHVGFPSSGAPGTPLSPRASAGGSVSDSPRSHTSASTAGNSSFGANPAARAARAALASASATTAGARQVGDAAGSLTAEEAAELLLDCVCEFNACVPYAGLTHEAEVDPLALAALLALLPEGIQPSVPAAAAALSPDDVKQAVAVLHCMQRLCGSALAADGLLATPGFVPRLWAALGSASDHVVAEAARLLVRLWAPMAARTGCPPWLVLRGAVRWGCVWRWCGRLITTSAACLTHSS
jgi:DnaJ family protein C protein 13